jgi:hypothetical protein
MQEMTKMLATETTEMRRKRRKRRKKKAKEMMLMMHVREFPGLREEAMNSENEVARLMRS